METSRRITEESRKAEINSIARKTGIKRDIGRLLQADGTIKSVQHGKVAVVDVVRFQRANKLSGRVDRGHELEVEYTDPSDRRRRTYLNVVVDKPELGSNDLPLSREQIEAIRSVSRFEGDDPNAVFREFGIEKLLHDHYRSRGIDPESARVRVEGVYRLPGELFDQVPVVGVAVMYTLPTQQTVPEAFLFDKDSSFGEENPLTPRMFQVLLDMAAEVKPE